MRGSSISPPDERAAAPPSKPPAAERREPGETPATIADVRGLRRWTAVAGVWAVAATAVGLIALLDTSGDEAERGVGQVSERVESLERDQARLERRLEALGERIDGLPQAEDLDTLEGRIGTVEEDAGEAASTASDTADRIDALEQRIEDLEQAPADAGGDDTTGDAAPGDDP